MELEKRWVNLAEYNIRAIRGKKFALPKPDAGETIEIIIIESTAHLLSDGENKLALPVEFDIDERKYYFLFHKVNRLTFQVLVKRIRNNFLKEKGSS
jgi:hypothetical protein